MNTKVAIPTSESQAAAMVILGMDWLKKNAPHRLTLHAWDLIASFVTRNLNEDASKPQGTFAGSNDRVSDTFIEPVTEYYYRTYDCPAEEVSDPDCTCWHKTGSGPLPHITPRDDNYTWRIRQVDQRQQPKAEPANIRERWNIERDGDALLVCFNDHEKSEGCQYVRYVRESDQKQDLISLALNQAIKNGTVMVKVIPNEEVFVNPQAANTIAAELRDEASRQHGSNYADELRDLLLRAAVAIEAAPQPQASAEDVALVDGLIFPRGFYDVAAAEAAWQRIRASLGVGRE